MNKHSQNDQEVSWRDDPEEILDVVIARSEEGETEYGENGDNGGGCWRCVSQATAPMEDWVKRRVTGPLDQFKEDNPRVKKAIDEFAVFGENVIVVSDLTTDILFYLTLVSENETWWSRFQLAFIIFPYLVCWAGFATYLKNTRDAVGATLGVFFGWFLIIVMEVVSLVDSIPYLSIGSYLSQEVAVIVVPYRAIRTLSSALAESLPQLALQVRILAIGDINNTTVAVGSISVSVISILYVGWMTYRKMKGVTVPQYLYGLVRIGGGEFENVLRGIADNRIGGEVDVSSRGVDDARAALLGKALQSNNTVTSIR